MGKKTGYCFSHNRFIKFCLDNKGNNLNDDVCYYMYYILINLNISGVEVDISLRTGGGTSGISNIRADLMLNNKVLLKVLGK